jgi:hypothetical protein
MSGSTLTPKEIEHVKAIAQWVIKHGASTPPPGYECGPVCSQLWLEEHRPMPNQVTSAKMHRELRALTRRSGVMNGIRAAGGIGMRISAIAGTAWLGYKIGTGINAKYLKIGIDDVPPMANGSYYEVLSHELVPINKGQQLTTQFASPNFYWTAPDDGFYWSYQKQTSSSTQWYHSTVTTGCRYFPDVAPPPFLTVTVATPANNVSCFHPSWGTVGATEKKGFATEDSLKQDAPSEEYTGGSSQPVDKQVPDVTNPPGGATVETKVQTELPSLPDVRHFLDETLPDESVFTIPAPSHGETYDEYVARLRALGWLGTAEQVVLTEATMDPRVEPDAVARTRPHAGTEVDVETAIRIYVNPSTAPPAPATGEGTPVPLPNGESDCGPTIPPIDLSALDVPLPDKFPFGVPFWIYGALSAWSAAVEAPHWTMHFPLPGLNLDEEISLEIFDPFMPVWRTTILIVSFIGMAWMFMSAALGFGTSRDD